MKSEKTETKISEVGSKKKLIAIIIASVAAIGAGAYTAVSHFGILDSKEEISKKEVASTPTQATNCTPTVEKIKKNEPKKQIVNNTKKSNNKIASNQKSKNKKPKITAKPKNKDNKTKYYAKNSKHKKSNNVALKKNKPHKKHHDRIVAAK